jgi:hypothetical protein
MIALCISGFFDILNQKKLSVSSNASGKVALPSPLCARNALFMRLARRMPVKLNLQKHEEKANIRNRSQTHGLHLAVQRVTDEEFPPEQSGGPIEASNRRGELRNRIRFPPEQSGGPIEAFPQWHTAHDFSDVSA